MLEVDSLVVQQGNERFEWSLQLQQGQFMAVIGSSGVGKSTLLNCLLGFAVPESGRILWHGDDLTKMSVQDRPFSILFQKNNLFEHLTVKKNIALGLSPSGRLNMQQQKQLEHYAARFELTHLLPKKSAELSGGQQQRVALARVFLQNKPILLLDEPFSSLDPEFRAEGLQWVYELSQQQGTTVIMITHHLNEVHHVIDTVLEGVSSLQWNQYPAR